MMPQDRYAKIEELILAEEPRDKFIIIEVGVWNGGRAINMATAALKIAKRVEYIGFDLFDQATPEINLRELNAKPNQTIEHVTKRLTWFRASQADHRFSFDLIKGNTNETLKGRNFVADFVFIDGGHSVETIENDYAAFKACTLVVFDDYYIGLDQETLDKVGANRTVDALRTDTLEVSWELINTGDELKMGDVRGTVALAVVRRVPWPPPADEVEPGVVGAADQDPSPAASERPGDPIADEPEPEPATGEAVLGTTQILDLGAAEVTSVRVAAMRKRPPRRKRTRKTAPEFPTR